MTQGQQHSYKRALWFIQCLRSTSKGLQCSLASHLSFSSLTGVSNSGVGLCRVDEVFSWTCGRNWSKMSPPSHKQSILGGVVMQCAELPSVRAKPEWWIWPPMDEEQCFPSKTGSALCIYLSITKWQTKNFPSPCGLRQVLGAWLSGDENPGSM